MLKIKVKKLWWLIPTFVEVTGKELVGEGAFCHPLPSPSILNRVKCLIDRLFKMCNNWISFHNDIVNFRSNFIKNAYSPFLIDKVMKKYLDY